MNTSLNRNFKIRGDISCLYQPGSVMVTKQIENIEVQLWHKTPMQVTLLGKGITNSDGEFTIEFEVDSPVAYIVDGKIKNAFLEAYYKGQKLIIEEPSELLTGLVAYWKLDESSGTSASDATDNGHTGTLNGADIPTWTAGKINNGLNTHGGLDGTGFSYLLVTADDDFNFGSGDFTIAFWVKPNNTSGYYELFDTGYPAAESILFQFYSTSQMNLHVSGSGVISQGYTIVPGDWYYVVIRRVGTDIELLVNAVQISTATCADAISCPTAFCIGSANGGPDTLDGILDEFGVWKGRGLTDEEINTLYNLGNGLQYPF